MNLSVTFPLRNDAFVRFPFPVQQGNKVFSLISEDEKLKGVRVTWVGISTDVADRIEPSSISGIKFNINSGSSNHYVLMAEHDIRAWQSMVAGISLIDIDYDSPEIVFEPDNANEKEKLDVFRSSRTVSIPRIRGNETFDVLGRAFLALEEGRSKIEVIAHFRDASLAQRAGRFVDAYNQYYLFIESQFCKGKSKTKDAVSELTNSEIFSSALTNAARDYASSRGSEPLRFKGISEVDTNPSRLVGEIVGLRGELRHHSLGNPRRWNPNKQNEYSNEAHFLGQICNEIVFPMTTGKLWDKVYVEGFSELAKRNGFAMELHVFLTYRQSEQTETKQVVINVPQNGLDAPLALSVLQKAIGLVEQNIPGAELFSIRAVKAKDGMELFRYDVGAGLHR